jgi:hypothetical protein
MEFHTARHGKFGRMQLQPVVMRGDLQVDWRAGTIFNSYAANWAVTNVALTRKIVSSTAAGFRPDALWVGN